MINIHETPVRNQNPNAVSDEGFHKKAFKTINKHNKISP